jgi:subtilisin family serine protease
MSIQRFSLRYAIAASLAAWTAGTACAAPPPPLREPGSHAPRAATTLAGAERGLYLVQFAEPPVARRDLPRVQARPGRPPRPDLGSATARDLATRLQATQQRVLSEAMQPSGAGLRPLHSYQYAFNGVLVSLQRGQREALAAHPEVRRIEAVKAVPVQTDAGPGFIGAPELWNGVATGGLPGTRGEGVVVGVIDTGVNWNSPSFADIGGDGYDHDNPFGRRLGLCATRAAEDEGPACNDKLIGAYALSYPLADQINRECALPDPRDGELGLDPVICDSLGVPLVDSPTASDDNGHGSHTASTAVGNATHVVYEGHDFDISGVAPHANLVVYDACHTNRYGGGTCLTSATLAAIEQATRDGVDVINYSISGGVEPWSEAGSLAFLSAADTGVFTAAAAGNAGPDPATLSHLEPWTTTVAAVTHTREFAHHFSVDGPRPVPPDLVDAAAIVGSAGGEFLAAVPAGTPIVVSPGIDDADDACSAFDPGRFAGAVALIRRGTCEFTLKVRLAEEAGAVAVLVANHSPGVLRMGGAAEAAIPAFGITQAQGNALRDFVGLHPEATLGIPLEVGPVAVPGDTVAGFSSRGPSDYAAFKPDVAAPGVNVLAAVAGGADAYGLLSGTSMATPHVAGAAALLRALHPEWSVPELKSALMLTARHVDMVDEADGGSADAFERGAGRIDLTQAALGGLVMDESPLRMMFADPQDGGDPGTLNLPSLASRHCADHCSWTRTFRNTSNVERRYGATFRTAGAMTVEMVPATLVVRPGESAQVQFRADVTAAAPGSWLEGDLILQPSDASLPALTLPVGVLAIANEPAIELAPSPLGASVRVGSAPITLPLQVRNTGVRELTWQRRLDARVRGSALYSQRRAETVTVGAPSGRWLELGGQGAWLADAFVLAQAADVGGLFADGFVLQADAAQAYDAVTFHVFPDAFGVPAGDPHGSPEAAVWSYTAALGSPGLQVDDGDFRGSIQLDLVAAGQAFPLPAGKYWLVASTHNLGSFGDTREWYWFGTGASSARNDEAKIIDPNGLYGAGGNWQSASRQLRTDFAGLSFEVQRGVDCDAAWMSSSDDGGVLAVDGEHEVKVRIDPEGLPVGRYETALCFASDDPQRPLASVPLVMEVTGIPTNPTGVANVDPAQARGGDALRLQVTVTPGTWPDSTGLTVDVNLDPIGGSPAQRMYDDGSNGDTTARDNVFATRAEVAATIPPGEKVLRATIRDAQGRVRRAAVTLTVLGPSGTSLFADGFE